MYPTGHQGRGVASVQAVVAPHRPTNDPVRIVQAESYGPEEEYNRPTTDRDSGVFSFSETASERSTVPKIRFADGGKWKLAGVKKLPFGLGKVLWLGVSHIICEWAWWGRVLLRIATDVGHFFRGLACYWVSGLDSYCATGSDASGSLWLRAGVTDADVDA